MAPTCAESSDRLGRSALLARHAEQHLRERKVDVRLPGKGNSNSRVTRPDHLIITMIKGIWNSRLSMKHSLSSAGETALFCYFHQGRNVCTPTEAVSAQVLRERMGVQRMRRLFSCRANMAHIRKSRPDSGIGFQEKVVKTF